MNHDMPESQGSQNNGIGFEVNQQKGHCIP